MEKMGDIGEDMNTQLYNALCMDVTDEALTGIRRLEMQVGRNGFLSWWKIGHESVAVTANKIQLLANKTYSPTRANKYNEVPRLQLKLNEEADENNK